MTNQREFSLIFTGLFIAIILFTYDCANGEAGPGDKKLVPSGAYEHILRKGWIGAGQPGKTRLREVIESGARVISLRYPSEESFNEQAFVKNLGGIFIRHSVSEKEISLISHRQAMYDFLDAQFKIPGLVYIHCRSSNRVGALWALYLAERLGTNPKKAIQAGRDAGMGSLGPLVEKILGTRAIDPGEKNLQNPEDGKKKNMKKDDEEEEDFGC
ncbi:MAG: hypothetical protein GXP53_10615 [Deltaproteobacteria bacterium]|nr:hypothetical protein [Deltaproteobacteria bacterium]